MTTDWLEHGESSPSDAAFVRGVRERDLGDARALFGSYVALASILVAFTIAALNWQVVTAAPASWLMLIVALVAPIGVLVGLAGSWLALRRMTTTNRQLARIDARTMR